VKALHLTFDTSLWDMDDPEDMDWDQYCLRVFATEVLRHLPEDLHTAGARPEALARVVSAPVVDAGAGAGAWHLSTVLIASCEMKAAGFDRRLFFQYSPSGLL
jgi:hypothetical protein